MNLNILPPLERTNAGCQISQGFSPDKGVSGGHRSHSEKRDSTVSLLAMLHLLSLTVHNPNAKKGLSVSD